MADLLAVMLLGFPMGFFVPALISDLMRYLHFGTSNAGVLGYFTEWLIAASVGFVQWFILLPRLAKLFLEIAVKIIRGIRSRWT